jgi:hypothetical protein
VLESVIGIVFARSVELQNGDFEQHPILPIPTQNRHPSYKQIQEPFLSPRLLSLRWQSKPQQHHHTTKRQALPPHNPRPVGRRQKRQPAVSALPPRRPAPWADRLSRRPALPELLRMDEHERFQRRRRCGCLP